MAEAVYILCAATSLACAVLLLRAFGRSRARFLLWSGLCFALLAVNNVLLYFDLAVFGDEVDLRVLRHATALAGLLLLLFGLIWDAE
ncbi:MAG TPA: DUF5985 family protein [Tepidisphaeraceae bacterium]|nr:DUF5985 family protein [Tepidisphaeraceae bacterium]